MVSRIGISQFYSKVKSKGAKKRSLTGTQSAEDKVTRPKLVRDSDVRTRKLKSGKLRRKTQHSHETLNPLRRTAKDLITKEQQSREVKASKRLGKLASMQTLSEALEGTKESNDVALESSHPTTIRTRNRIM